MLQAIAEGVWVVEREQRFWRVEIGTRMTVVRLGDGGLFVHSPVALDADTRAAIEALGPVRALVAPSLFHHLYVAEWTRAFRDAITAACPGLDDKRPDIRWQRILGDVPEPEWRGDLEQAHFGARSLENEVVFFHPASGTMICSDTVFSLRHHPSRLTRTIARLLGNHQPGATYLERLIIRDRRRGRREVDRMLAWHPERIILAHGDIVEHDGERILANAYAWL